jgi:hypothetical protein
MEWSDGAPNEKDPSVPDRVVMPNGTQAPPELEHLLELEEPSVVECFNALEEAKKAVAESALEEENSPPSADLQAEAASSKPRA